MEHPPGGPLTASRVDHKETSALFLTGLKLISEYINGVISRPNVCLANEASGVKPEECAQVALLDTDRGPAPRHLL